MEMYKEEYTENFGLGDITGAVSNPLGAIGGAVGSGFEAIVEPIITTAFKVIGDIFGKWWATVQYFFLYLGFVGALVFILVVVFRLEFGAGAAARAAMLAKVAQ